MHCGPGTYTRAHSRLGYLDIEDNEGEPLIELAIPLRCHQNVMSLEDVHYRVHVTYLTVRISFIQFGTMSDLITLSDIFQTTFEWTIINICLSNGSQNNCIESTEILTEKKIYQCAVSL